MTVIANGLEKKLRYKRQATFGAPISGAAGGQALRRVTSNIDLSKNTYKSNEIRDDKQRNDFRHGSRMVGGTISGELSVGTYADFFETFCRQTYQAAATTGAAIATVAVTAVGNVATYTRTGGSFITDGFKLGDVGRWTGWTTTAAPQNANNFMVTALSALTMSGIFLNGTVPVAKVAGDNVSFLLQGKKTWVPLLGHTNDCYTVEHWYSDILQSEVFDSCRLGTMKLSLPPTGIATIELGFTGRDMLRGVTSYFAAPGAPSTGGALAAVNGLLIVNGVQVAILTGLSIDGNGNATTSEVVGSNTTPDVFMGSVDVSGQITAHFQDASFRDLFVDETEASMMMAFTADNTPTAGFLGFVLPRIKAGGASKDDGEKGLTLTMPFTALLGAAVGGTSLPTTLSVQDSSK